MHCDGVSLKGEMVTGSHGIRLKSVQNSHKYNLCIKWKGNEVYSFLNTSFKRKHDTYCNC